MKKIKSTMKHRFKCYLKIKLHAFLKKLKRKKSKKAKIQKRKSLKNQCKKMLKHNSNKIKVLLYLAMKTLFQQKVNKIKMQKQHKKVQKFRAKNKMYQLLKDNKKASTRKLKINKLSRTSLSLHRKHQKKRRERELVLKLPRLIHKERKNNNQVTETTYFNNIFWIIKISRIFMMRVFLLKDICSRNIKSKINFEIQNSALVYTWRKLRLNINERQITKESFIIIWRTQKLGWPKNTTKNIKLIIFFKVV